ncbi:MAG: S-methyl-5-thioribose-1-phosphate isomerase [Candidatus Eisenbacteria bacterium]|nr:S-methyl-5-thioribose-1-phosphate isomerase [Candidatus Eisenbacteria bacterium]
MPGGERVRTIEWLGNAVRLIDQTRLPGELVYKETRDYRDIAESIRRLEVRGAPAIGVAAAMGVALAALSSGATDVESLRGEVGEAARLLASTRPTAVNLVWALDRMLGVASDPSLGSRREITEHLVAEAIAICDEDRSLSRRIGEHGRVLIDDGDGVLTHCNAGGLATAEYGTALAVVFAAAEQGKRIRVYADETRPLLQGARLTTWELMQRGMDVTLLCDSAAASAMSRGWVQKVVVGADRIARNGDVANKIGTFPLALAAREHGIPFYVAAPFSTLDPALPDGSRMPIEVRDPAEVTEIGGVRIAPQGVSVYNPAFDVTPARLISAIITDAGVFRAPYGESLFRNRHALRP